MLGFFAKKISVKISKGILEIVDNVLSKVFLKEERLYFRANIKATGLTMKRFDLCSIYRTVPSFSHFSSL